MWIIPSNHPLYSAYAQGGLRGIEKGLALALGCEAQVAAFVENEAFIIENLLDTMEAGLLAPTSIWTDVRTFPYASLYGRIHGIVGGYPCQPFSLAGLRKGENDPRHLWPFIRKGIFAARPIFVFFENVDDHLTMGFDQVYKDLREMGYLVEAGIYSSEEAGAPHERQRLYIFAIRQEMAYANGYDPGRIFDNVFRTQRQSLIKENQRQRNRDEPSTCGEAMADTGSQRIYQGSGEQQSEQPESDGVQGRNELGNAAGIGREGLANEPGSNNETSDREKQWGGITRADTPFRGYPAGQGPDQYRYEAPRTVESKLVYNINGYGFMGDLHRAIGNSVQPQVAALAFTDLLNKHAKHHRK